MKKTKLTRSLLAACSIVALSAVMYGCVHSSDDPAPEPMTTPEPPTPEDVDMSGVDADAMAAAGTYMIDAGGMHTAGDVTFSCAAGGDACSVTVAADGSASSTGGMVMAATSQAFMDAAQIAMLQGQINALRTQLGLGPADSLSDSITQLQSDLADLQKQVDDAQDEKDKMAAEAAAKDAEALFAGIEVDRGTAGTVDLAVALTGTATVDGETVNLGVTDTHGSSAAVAATVDVDGDGAAFAAVTATDAMEPMLAGEWKGTQLTGANDAGTTSNTVVVYTDIDAPMQVAFGEVYTLDAQGHLTGAYGKPAAQWLQHADNRSKIVAADFMHAGRMDHDPDPASKTDVAMIRGSFNGASGEYRCVAATATSCVSHDDGDGAVRLEGAWLFDPDVGAMAIEPDATYLYFGWWLYKDSTGPEVAAFHGVTGTGLTAMVDKEFTALGGTATYVGGAAGKYAIDPVSPGTNASGGHWTAEASLTADFGNETAPGTISGMIDNFMAGGEEMDWSVALGETALTAAAPIATFDSGANATAEATTPVAGDDVVWTIAGEAAPEAGSWSGALRNQGDDHVPTMATGMFSATYNEDGHEIGHMIGAFGAHLDE